MKIIIRDYISGDYPQIELLWKITGLGGAIRGDNQKIIENSLKIGGKFLVIEDIRNSKVIGTSWMTFDGRRLHLHHFGIDPKHQRHGYGKALTEASLSFAKEKGIQIKLEVHKENLPAIELYKSMGFQYLGDYDVYIIRNI
ncbi:MAG: GNAT family N-acetyltransferase [Bacteroidetes bacterium]|jgi:ribosomal protein S18 acetylase RimI-like enzyme|nr:GNAT family N-acetyltransferase [Bacteroidota bacterium]MBT6687309.1 GNAT family N-acetyltransferase [Bacteroidota bacterium]MBT7143973.1 GNAT family N-acetyltransferase [Bacteroidota bacterium]MBT7491114.1 GNAT family N-acetyltransferase [Bacteroidota bacterium]